MRNIQTVEVATTRAEKQSNLNNSVIVVDKNAQTREIKKYEMHAETQKVIHIS